MRRNLRSTLTFLFGWPLSIIALFFLAKSFLSHSSQITFSFNTIQWPLLLLGFLFLVGYFFLRSYIWYTLLKNHGHSLDIYESLFNWSLAQLKRYIPGNIWGVVGVTMHFSKKNISKNELTSSLMAENFLVLLAGGLFSLFSLPLIVVALKITSFQNLLWQVGIISVALASLLYFFSGKLQRVVKLPHFISYIITSFPPQQLVALWGMMVAAFFCFGAGTYFIANSITYIDPNKFWIFTGYFIFSLLIGFVSFITPTGLGVREGIITLGLQTVMSVSLSAFISLLARFVLILAELFFITVAYFVHKTRSGIMSKITAWIQSHPHEVLLILLYTIFVCYFSFISILRYQNFYAGRFDLGNMEQTVWNTVHGNIFELTNPNGTNIVSRLAFHADFILILLAPIYYFWQSPLTLLIIQAVVTGAGAFFVYLLSLHLLKNKTLSFVLASLYLLNPSLERSVIYDFHAVTLVTTFLLAAFYFILKKKYVWFVVFAILAGVTKEQIWTVIALFGIYIALFHKKRIFGLGIFVISSLITYLLIWKLIPQAAGSQHFALSYYTNGEAVDSPTTLLKSFLFSPMKTLALLTDPDRINYLIKLFSPLGYLAIFSPFFLIFTGPDLTINLLSSKSELYQIYYQYTAAITPFIFISSIYGIKFLLDRVQLITPFIITAYLVVVGLYTAYLYGPLPGAKEANLDMITRTNVDSKDIDHILAAIPPEYSVSTSNSLGSHVTHRPYLFTIPNGWDNADYIIFLTNETNAFPSLADHKKRIAELKSDRRYVKYFDDGILVAFRKKEITAPIMN